MVGVSYALVDFRTGGPILDVPVNKGATWTAQLNRADELSCTVSLRAAEARSLDLRAASEPRKTVLLAQTDSGAVLAWGLIDTPRAWDENKQTVKLTAKGVLTSFYGANPIGPAGVLTDWLVDPATGLSNPALDTNVTAGYSLGTIGKKLVEQLHTWPGAPAITLPPDQAGTHVDSWFFPDLKRVGAALTDISNRENGPDFAFDAYRGSNGLTIEYAMRHGSEANPDIGTDLGFVWPISGPASPITDLKVNDDTSDLASLAFVPGGRNADRIMLARARNESLITTDGYPPLTFVDGARNSVVLQETLDDYALAAAAYASTGQRSLSFNVRADASPGLGFARPGDRVTLGVPDGHPWLTADIKIKLTSLSGDERGRSIKIGCVIV